MEDKGPLYENQQSLGILIHSNHAYTRDEQNADLIV
jgi:hypothetical protein